MHVTDTKCDQIIKAAYLSHLQYISIFRSLCILIFLHSASGSPLIPPPPLQNNNSNNNNNNKKYFQVSISQEKKSSVLVKLERKTLLGKLGIMHQRHVFFCACLILHFFPSVCVHHHANNMLFQHGSVHVLLHLIDCCTFMNFHEADRDCM